ncbi:MAG TPA: O-antigen ligase family protein [Candidatus Acidoferrum sp.]|nr:O-antigen ligase family protein [Candidatus Acidoferrum sp.]
MTSPLVIHESTPPRPVMLGGLLTGYVALLPYQFEMAKGLNFAPSDVLLLLMLLLAGGQLRYCKPAWSVWHFAIAAILAIGSLVAVLRFGTLEQYELLNKDAGLLLPFLSYAAITTSVTQWDDLRRVLRVFVLSVVLENMVAVAAFLLAYFFGLPNPFARYGGLRLSGVLLDPNAYGGLLVAALVICEGASWGRTPLFQSTTLWISRLSLGLGILFTFSRSAWVALAAALVLLCVLRIKVALRLILAGAIGAAGLFLLMGHRFIPIFEQMASRPKQVQGRFDLIHSALEAFSLHPFLGGGIGSFRLSEGEVAHNSAMWFLADFGIVGLTVLLGFLGWFFVKGWYAYRFAPTSEQPLVLGLLLAHAAMLGLAMGIEAFYQRHWWLVFGLIASSYSLALRRTNDPHYDYRGLW